MLMATHFVDKFLVYSVSFFLICPPTHSNLNKKRKVHPDAVTALSKVLKLSNKEKVLFDFSRN